MQNDANSAVSYFDLGNSQQSAGEFEEAIASYRKAIEINPAYAIAYNNLGNTLQLLGKLAEAEESYLRALKLEENFPEALINLGNTQRAMGKFDEAERSYRQAIANNSNLFQAHCNLGVTLLDIGRTESSIECFEKAINLEPNIAQVHNNLSIALMRLGQDSEAAIVCRKALSLDPDSAVAHNNLGTILQKTSRLEEAQVSFLEAIRLRPTYAEPYNNLGNNFRKQCKPEAAEKYYRTAISLNANFADAYCNLAIVFNEQEKYVDAEKGFLRALALKPNYGDAYYNLGNTLKAVKRYDEAITKYNKVSNPAATSLVLECLYIAGRYDDFFERLNMVSNLNRANIRVAAISAFVSNQVHKKDIYPFCPDPIRFLKIAHLSNFIDEWESLVSNILVEATSYELTWESRTTKFGYQSVGNLFDKSRPHAASLEQVINLAIASYLEEFGSETNVFIKEWPKKTRIMAWFNKLMKKGYQKSHIHPSSWLSGVVYLETIDSLSGDEGAIELGLHGYDLPILDAKYPRITHSPKRGDLILFPSSLFHRTLPFTTEQSRCVIAFDLAPINEIIN